MLAAPIVPAHATSVSMRWVLGIDLRPRTEGALRQAAWMASRGNAHFVGVRVVPGAVRVSTRDDTVDELAEDALAQAQQVVARAGLRSSLDVLETIIAPSIEQALVAQADLHGVDAILLGRNARRQDASLVRLGRVARRLVRSLPRPVMIVPPDHDPDARSGPVLLATDLHDDAVAAGRFALRLAHDMQRELVAVHVVRTAPFRYMVRQPGTSADEIDAELTRWIDRHGLGGAAAFRCDGEPVERLIDEAEAMRAVCVVVGSRHLSSIDRVFQSSTGTDLARFAACPVLVVPAPITKNMARV